MKLPIAFTLGNRDASLDKDALMRNGLAEVEGDIVRARKRPAIDSAYTTATGQGQLLFTWTTPGPLGPEETLVAVSDDTLNYGASITTLTKSLRFVQNPTSPQNISTSFSPSVTVEAIDKAGNRVTSFTSNVTVAFVDNPTSATLGGTLTQAAVAGLATFNNLTSTRSGQDFSLGATATGLMADTSLPFSIPTHCVFTTQPSDANPGDPIVCVVTVKDTAGNADTNYTGDITVSIFSNPTGATLGGTTTVAATAGVASFSDLTISLAGTYSLKATAGASSSAYTPASQISSAFTVGMTMTSDSLVVGPPAGTIYGYSSGVSLGSLTPDTFAGQTIVAIVSASSTNSTDISISGLQSQNLWTSVTINGTTLFSADAVFTPDVSASIWDFPGVGVLVGVIGEVSVGFA